MEIPLAPELEAKLNVIASEAGKRPNQVVQELVADYLDHNEWFKQEVGKGAGFTGQWQVRFARGSTPPDGPHSSLIMKVSWSPEAAADFAAIVAYIREQNPSAAERVAHAIYDGVSSLSMFSNRGRPGRIKDTRELVLAPLPFIAVYRVMPDSVEIARVLHGSQRWP